jgi:pimeloyl-ACP methyl ester carboxylesterase
MPEVMSQATRISYVDQGQDEPAFLFLPGWCGSRTVFNQLAATHATGRRTLSLDWRGHGQSETPLGDFGSNDLVEDALSVIESSGAARIVPVALSHAGWVAIELRRRLGPRISHLVFLDWIILEAPPPFLEVLQSLQDPSRWHQTREQLFDMWLHGIDNPGLVQYVREDMGSYGFDMWARAGREISAAYTQVGSPLQALTHLAPAVPVLHLYAQPEDPVYLAAQQAFAANHPWFTVWKLEARSHFPTLEVAEQIAAAIEQFVVQEPID